MAASEALMRLALSTLAAVLVLTPLVTVLFMVGCAWIYGHNWVLPDKTRRGRIYPLYECDAFNALFYEREFEEPDDRARVP